MTEDISMLIPIEEFIDDKYCNVPIYLLERQWQDEDLQVFIQSSSASIFSLKLYFEQTLLNDWKRQAGDFLLKELAFYFRLSSVRPKNEKWSELLDSLPRANKSFWQAWLHRQIMLLLEIDEDLLKSIYYHFSFLKKKHQPVIHDDLFQAYRDLSQEGRFNLDNFNKVVDYFSKKLNNTKVLSN